MLKRKKLVLCLLASVFTCFANQVVLKEPLSSFAIQKIDFPSEVMIQNQAQESASRELKRMVLTGTTGVVAICALFWALSIKEDYDRLSAKESLFDLKEAKKILKQKALQNLIDENISKIQAECRKPESVHWLKNMSSVVVKQGKLFTNQLSKTVSQVLLTMTIGTLINSIYATISQKWQKIYLPESISWFVQEKTNIAMLFQDLKSRSISYDLSATALSFDAFNKDAQISMKAFMQDVSTFCAAHAQLQQGSTGYLDYMIEELKKKHTRNGTVLDKRYEYVLEALIKTNQLKYDVPHFNLLQEYDQHRRADIALLCNMLSGELQKLIAFIMHKNEGKCKSRVEFLIDVTNKFFEAMQSNLNADQETLHTLSVADHGMFSNVYAFEKFFLDEINFMHRHCRS